MADDTPNGLIARMADTSRRLTWAMLDVDESDLKNPMEEGGWSPMQLLAHVKACNDIMRGRIALVATTDGVALPTFDEKAWAEIAGYADAVLGDTLAAYNHDRDELVSILQRLPSAVWEHTCVHQTRGTLALPELLRSFIAHEEEHVLYLESALADDE